MFPQKKQRKFSKYVKYLILFTVIIFGIIFRAKVVGFYFSLKQRYFLGQVQTELLLTEREELNALRVENKVLRDENKKIQDEFSIAPIDEAQSPILMLMNGSRLYGAFYSSLPKNKTPYKGMNVFSEGNVLVGTVDEILPTSMRIEKLGQNKTFVANSLENDESLELSSLGSGLYIGNAPSGSKISLGDTMVQKGYPKAIIGTVVEVQKGDSSLSNVFVRTPYNIDDKEIFYVIQ